MRQSRSDVRQGDAADRALDHPDIVHVYDIATDADTTFIAMEHVPGKTLGELCRPLAQPAAANRVCWPGSCRSSSGSLLNHQMNEDFLDPLRAFIDAAARFLVVGAYALAHHGRPRMFLAWNGCSALHCRLDRAKTGGVLGQAQVVGSLVPDKRVSQSDLDERLPSDAEPPGLLINLTQQVDWEVHVHPLDRAAGSDGLGQIHVRRQIPAGVVHGVQFGGRECSSLGGTLLLLHRVLASRR